jgi:hypothetical protein
MTRTIMLATVLAVSLSGLVSAQDEGSDLNRAWQDYIRAQGGIESATPQPPQKPPRPSPDTTPEPTAPAPPQPTPSPAEAKAEAAAEHPPQTGKPVVVPTLPDTQPAAATTKDPSAETGMVQTPLRWQPTMPTEPTKPIMPIEPTGLTNTDIVILVDRSASMVGHFEWVKQDLRERVTLLGTHNRILVIAFDGEMDPVYLNGDFQDNEGISLDIDRLAQLQAAGNTDMLAALRTAEQAFRQLETPKPGRAILIYSDGLFRDSHALLSALPDKPDGGKVPIHTLLFGEYTSRSLVMESMARRTAGRFEHVTRLPSEIALSRRP